MKSNLLQDILATITALFAMTIALPALAQEKEAYVHQSTDGTTLAFYYDTQRASRTGTTYAINDTKTEDDVTYPAWAGEYENPNILTTKVVFDASFKDFRPKSTAYWFRYCEALSTLTGMENLNTADVTDMRGMFFRCIVLTSLDVSNFNTANVTDMNSMFFGCKALTSLDLSNFNTEAVTNMGGMFTYCDDLTSLDLSNFNTANVTDMSSMFTYCPVLTALNLSNFNTETVTNMSGMFLGCTALISLDLSNFNTAGVTDMNSMFTYCTTLSSLDLSNFNTAGVTDMSSMFCGCPALTSLDLSNFNTAKVTNMEYMFSVCIALTTIYCNDDWKSERLPDSDNMFSYCANLKGAVPFDESKTDATMANPTTGYFTRKESTAISHITSLPADSRTYNLAGQRVGDDYKGIVVKSGRKVFK